MRENESLRRESSKSTVAERVMQSVHVAQKFLIVGHRQAVDARTAAFLLIRVRTQPKVEAT